MIKAIVFKNLQVQIGAGWFQSLFFVQTIVSTPWSSYPSIQVILHLESILFSSLQEIVEWGICSNTGHWITKKVIGNM